MSERVRQLDEIDWRLHKQKNETPCCYQQVRVKIVEPGPQMRKCDLCKSVNWFVLEPMAMVPGLLKLRWMTDGQVEAMQEAEREGIADGLDVRDL
jgi:hypothetical protein